MEGFYNRQKVALQERLLLVEFRPWNDFSASGCVTAMRDLLMFTAAVKFTSRLSSPTKIPLPHKDSVHRHPKFPTADPHLSRQRQRTPSCTHFSHGWRMELKVRSARLSARLRIPLRLRLATSLTKSCILHELTAVNMTFTHVHRGRKIHFSPLDRATILPNFLF